MKRINSLSTEKVAIITQALHHLEKAIVVKETIFPDANILNFYQNKSKLSSHKENFDQSFIRHYESFDQIDILNLSEINIFILFSFSPTLPLVTFLNQIKESQRKIIFIQDNHQFSIHQGSVNSINFRPNLIIAASDNERDLITKHSQIPADNIISEGWLFAKSAEDSKNRQVTNSNKYLLIAFSAHSKIALLSEENYCIRKEIISWAHSNFPDHKLLLKLHPHENLKKFNEFIKKYNFPHKLLSSQSSISSAINLSNVVICSNESQIPLDVIASDVQKKLILYFLGKENFLQEKSTLYSSKEFYYKNLKLGSLKIQERKRIKELELSIKNNAQKNVIAKVANCFVAKESDIDFRLDILLWLFTYKKEKNITDYLQKHSSEKYNNLLQLLLKKKFDIGQLGRDFLETSIRDPLCIIIIRHYISNHRQVSNEDIKILATVFFSEHLFQFFFRDLIRLHNYMLSRDLNVCFEKKYIDLIAKIEYFYKSKFVLYSLFFRSLKRLYAFKIKGLSYFIFYISDKILRI